MNENEIFSKCVTILMEITALEEDEIKMDSALIEDLGIESFDLADLNYKLKEVFNINSEYDFLSVEGIVGNPDFIDDENRLKKAGLEEMQKRVHGLEINEEMLKSGVLLADVLNMIKVSDMVNFVKQNQHAESA
ncbi:MAG: hypothetical protein JXB88_18160 [Spirochaetales bacterium]|nr:hypothetical protein [Spirochaetales bacterium]